MAKGNNNGAKLGFEAELWKAACKLLNYMEIDMLDDLPAEE